MPGADLVETESTPHTDVDRELFAKLPLESAASSLSSLVSWPLPAWWPIPMDYFMASAITPKIHFPWTANRLPTSKARFSPTSAPSMPFNPWK